MYVLTATDRTQETFDSDFCFTMPGELVCFPFVECDCPDCGCRQSWAGLTSRRGTTTVEITEWPDLAEEDYRDLIVEHWDEQLDGYSLADDVEFVNETDSFIANVQNLGAVFGAGTVLRRIGGMTFVAPTTSTDAF